MPHTAHRLTGGSHTRRTVSIQNHEAKIKKNIKQRQQQQQYEIIKLNEEIKEKKNGKPEENHPDRYAFLVGF